MYEQAIPETAVRKNRGLPHGKERFRFTNPAGLAAVSEEKLLFEFNFSSPNIFHWISEAIL
jgi:hypothetical protein